jgi:phage protein D/phage baseplate assembly protein gpV
MPGQQYANTFTIDVGGHPLSDPIEALLVSAYVDDSTHVPDLFVLRFRDPDRTVLKTAGITIGATVRVAVMSAESNQPVPLISGEVTALEAEHDSTGTYTVVRGLDHSHRLFRSRTTETYEQVTASDVASTVAKRAGLTVGGVASTTTVYDHVSQGNATDWDFLSALARETGHEVAVVDGKFEFREPTDAQRAQNAGGRTETQPLVLELGNDLLSFRALVTSAEQVADVAVRGWDVATKKAVVGTAKATTKSAILSAKPADLASKFGAGTLVCVDYPYASQAEVDGAAAALAEEVAGTFAEFEGVARGNPQLHAGTAICIGNLGDPFDGKYTITGSRHVYDPDTGYTTWLTVSGRQERSLFGLSSGPGSPDRRISGVVVGQVSDAKDPQDAGRVRLTFPWMSDDYVSDWARLLQPGAGKDRGSLVVPEVGDEVLVAFEQGELRRPYVLGGVHNGVDTPPAGEGSLVDGSSGAINRRSFVSRTGQRLDFHDAANGARGVRIMTGDKKLKLDLDEKATRITVHSDGSVVIEATKGVTVDAGSDKIELTGGSISLKASSGGVSIDGGSGDVKVKSNAGVSVKGMTVSVDGSAQTEVKGGSMCSVSAQLVKIN